MKRLNIAGIAACLLLAFSCTKEPLQTPTTASVESADNNTLQTAGHYIGERFGGGVIFLLNKTRDHGLIADTVDLGDFPWWNGTYTVTGATKTGYGAGKANTRKIIISQGKYGSYAALECAKSVRSGYDDWFLPSKDELYALYLKRTVIGGRFYARYWSSTEDDIEAAWRQEFIIGEQYLWSKDGSASVRAIRAF